MAERDYEQELIEAEFLVEFLKESGAGEDEIIDAEVEFLAAQQAVEDTQEFLSEFFEDESEDFDDYEPTEWEQFEEDYPDSWLLSLDMIEEFEDIDEEDDPYATPN